MSNPNAEMPDPRYPPNFLFELERPTKGHLSTDILNPSIAALRALTPDSESGSRNKMDSIVDRLVERIQSARQNGWSWEEATQVRRRNWAILRMYLLHLGSPGTQQWLHPFDENVASSTLGTDPSHWHSSKRRDVTQLFFSKFDLLQSLGFVASMLRQAWNNENGRLQDPAARTWKGSANFLFSEEGPETVAHQLRPGEGIDEICNRFHIPTSGRFRECLYEEFILGQFKSMPLGEVPNELLRQCENEKDRQMRDGRLLGSKAVEILVKRSLSEAGGLIPESWSQQLVALACDPRTPDAALAQRWWGWATQEEKRAAIRAMAAMNIREFIDLLEQSLRSTGNTHQFPPRKQFLLKLLKNQVILDARVVVHTEFYRRLDPQTRRTLIPSQVSGGPQWTSFICLHCERDVFLVEGTFNFALRGYVGREHFPIKGFWSAEPKHYDDSAFRVSKIRCDIFQTHHQGDWEGSVLHRLRNNFHIDWNLRR